MAIRTTYISNKPREGSTFAVLVSFYDDDDEAVIPTSITWSLYDADGNIVNSREDVAFTPPAASITIVLSGNDLPTGELELLINAIYDSDLGSGLPLRDAMRFTVVDLPD